MIALARAAAWGLNPIFYTNHPGRYSGLADTGCQVHVCDTNDPYHLQQHIRDTIDAQDIQGIATTSEFYLEQVAALTAQYQLPGNPIEVVRKVRNKAETRRVLAQAGILQPQFGVVRHESELDAAIRSVGLPCVVKPTDDSGSNEVRLCSSPEMAAQQMTNILRHQVNVRGQATSGAVLVEEYVQAPEFSVETISWQGKAEVIGITQKSLAGLPFFVEAGHLFPALLSKEQSHAIIQAVLHALEAVGFRNGAAHTEVKWTAQGCSIIEINGRLAGGMIPELIRLTTGVDLLEQQLLCAFRGPTVQHVTYKGTAGIRFLISDTVGQVTHITGMDQAVQMHNVKDVKVNVLPGCHVSPPQNAYQRLGYVIAHGGTCEETVQSLDHAVQQIQIIAK
ncbi:ATP-grasp domain-containing protein [Paenibacillus popilliae]|uniref:Biotin carboxylase n=1 Tax=Paenibacillus popilliae ATCC 14706 TaxID=1212764 RepID=M9LMA6_PAEPP|nr:ATP-grasp domain-containing protein [Paenibacillus popilliae]GAC44490.1 biotin carboxylase [Paenibacillus popilliae ATCC 14706]